MIGDVRPVHVQRVIDEASASGLSARTVTQIRAILGAAFHSAVRRGLISINPVDGTTPPKLEPPQLTMPTPEDIGKLLAGIDPNYRAALAVAVADCDVVRCWR